MSEKSLASRLLKLLYFALALAALWLALRFLLPWFLPFLLAFFTARLLRPAVKLLTGRAHFPRALASALCCTLALALLAGLLGLILGRLLFELAGAVRRLPQFLAGLPDLGAGLEERIYKWVIAAPVETQDFLFSAVDSVLDAAAGLPGRLYDWLLSLLSALANGAPGFVLGLAAFAIGLFLFSSSYEKICAFILAQIPPRYRRGAQNMKRDMVSTLARWFKTQLILMGITFLELTLAFLLLGVSYPVLTALGISLLDALPVLGAGLVLAPWGLYQLLLGRYGMAAALLGLWALVALVREAVEPKLLGSQIGLHPAATLVAMYVGFRALGMPGMILSPLLLITLKQLNEQGAIKLWKTEV